MLRTRLYTVHLNPNDPKPYESAVFVPDGFYLSAFIFQTLWALYHRLWFASLLFFVIQAAASWSSHRLGLDPAIGKVLELGAAILFGFFAADLWRDTLDRRGWVISDIVVASNLLEAERRYYDRHFVHASALPAAH